VTCHRGRCGRRSRRWPGRGGLVFGLSLHGLDEGPVVADWAALEPGGAEADGCERAQGRQVRLKDVAFAAPDTDFAAETYGAWCAITATGSACPAGPARAPALRAYLLLVLPGRTRGGILCRDVTSHASASAPGCGASRFGQAAGQVNARRLVMRDQECEGQHRGVELLCHTN
jgi:hypothetical protein